MTDTRVEIYGLELTLASELDPAHLEELARLVDATMRSLARQTHILDTRRLAVLAALNLADQLHRLRRELASRQEPPGEPPPALPREFAARLEACSRQLDAALQAGDGA